MQKTILLLGWGKMGNLEGKALLALAPELATKGIELHLAVVERQDDRRADSAAYADSTHPTYQSALEALSKKGMLPEIVVMAFNDSEHFHALRYVLENAASVKAVFSEKPLTATDEEARSLYPLLADKFVSLDTIINFSSVFDKLHDALKGQALSLVKVECVWEKDRTADTRPTIGIASDIVHPLGIVSEMLEQGNLRFVKGSGDRGYLSERASDVIHTIDTEWVTEQGVPVHLRASYAAPEQQRQVKAFYRKDDGQLLVAELNFDISRGCDGLDLYIIDHEGQVSSPFFSYRSKEEDVDTGYQNMPKKDKVSAFIGWSMRGYIDPDDRRDALKLTCLDRAMFIQSFVSHISEGDDRLLLRHRSAANVLDERRNPQRPSLAAQPPVSKPGPKN